MIQRREKVIILRTIKNGESDLVIHALNREGAKLGLFARGAAKSRKRFGGGVLEPSHYVDITYQVRGQGDIDQLATLTEAQLVRGFEGLRTDFDRLQTALYFLELVAKVAQEGSIDCQDLFDLLGNALGAAETSSQLLKLKLHFQLKVLGGQGVLPDTEFAAQWSRIPLKDHGQIELPAPDLRALEWSVHHGLEAYLGR